MIFATEAEAQENRMLELVAGNRLIMQRVLATQINCRILSPLARSGRWAWGQSTTALGPLPTFACSPGDVARRGASNWPLATHAANCSTG